MHISKYVITMASTSNNSSTGGTFSSTACPNGTVYAVEYTRGTATFASTGVVNVYAGSTVRSFLSKSFSTDSWIVYPRKQARDTTDGLIGAATDYALQACVPLSGTDLITVGFTGGTSAAQDATLSVYVEGV